MNKTIEDALAYADTFDKPANKHMSIVMLATEVRRQRAEISAIIARAESAESELKKAREQEPVAWNCGGDITQNNEYAVWFRAFACKEVAPLYAAPKPAAPDSNSLEFGGIKPAALAVPDALRMELEWLEGWLHCMAEPMGQACCKRSMFECCGSPDPVYPDIAHIGTAMSKRRNDVIALLQSAGERK